MRLQKQRLLCLLLVTVLLLTACTTAAAPEQTPEPDYPEGSIPVSSVDELLAAIAPNTTIVLREGDYDLSTASDYGDENHRGYYRWELVYGGCALIVSNVSGLRLIGSGQVNLLARPRYAEVLSFRECWDLSLEGLTLGHTTEPGGCSAGVLNLSDCDDVELSACRLFGCGSMGITATNCRSLAVRESTIDSCSDGAVTASGCRDIRLEDCKLRDCGLSEAGPGITLIDAQRCSGFALVNCEITGNRVNRLLHSRRSGQTVMLGCLVENNRVLGSVFELEGQSVTVDRCAFRLRGDERFYTSAQALFAVDTQGEPLISFDLERMEHARAAYDGPVEPEPQETRAITRPDGMQEVHVGTVDELLAAIAPNTCVVLEPGSYDLSLAADYGGRGGEWYVWEDCYDGYTLCLINLEGLWISGSGQDNTVISAEPRYASVFTFRGCRDIGLADFTAGHTEAPSACTGNVLDFYNCSGVSVERCGLFGCGVMGIYAVECENLQVQSSEIYDCSYAGVTLDDCWAVSFDGCSIHDCDYGNNTITQYRSAVTWDGEELSEGTHRFDHERYLGRAEAAW